MLSRAVEIDFTAFGASLTETVKAKLENIVRDAEYRLGLSDNNYISSTSRQVETFFALLARNGSAYELDFCW